MTIYSVEATNPFHAGWLGFLFGFDPPSPRSGRLFWLEGYQMAQETRSLEPVRAIFQAQGGLKIPQYRVDARESAVSPSQLETFKKDAQALIAEFIDLSGELLNEGLTIRIESRLRDVRDDAKKLRLSDSGSRGVT